MAPRAPQIKTADKALFLDRDGIICKPLPRGEYLVRWDQFVFQDGIRGLVEFAKQKGYRVIVATNQSQVARGLLLEGDLADIHDKMNQELPGLLDRVYYCPHIDEDNCECRKPKPGLLTHAASDFGIDLTKSFFVGDSFKDVNAGTAAGCITVFLHNEYNREEFEKCRPHYAVRRLGEVKAIL